MAFEARQSSQKVLVENLRPSAWVEPATRVEQRERMAAEEWYRGIHWNDGLHVSDWPDLITFDN